VKADIYITTTTQFKIYIYVMYIYETGYSDIKTNRPDPAFLVIAH